MIEWILSNNRVSLIIKSFIRLIIHQVKDFIVAVLNMWMPDEALIVCQIRHETENVALVSYKCIHGFNTLSL